MYYDEHDIFLNYLDNLSGYYEKYEEYEEIYEEDLETINELEEEIHQKDLKIVKKIEEEIHKPLIEYNINQKEFAYFDKHVSLNFFGNLNIKKSNKYQKQEIKRKKEVIKLIAGLDSIVTIKEIVIKKLLLDNLDYMIFTYTKKESLPNSFMYISKQNSCISILIKGVLKKYKFIMDINIAKEIDELEKEIYINKDKLIVYDRVGIIQKFIHNKMNKKYGKNGYLKLSAILMKNTLSALRLHLNIHDIKKLGIKKLIETIKQSEKISINEEKHPFKIKYDGSVSLENSKRIRDIKSLIDFSYFNVSKKVYDISELKENISIEIFKDEVISIYTNLGFYSKKTTWI